MDRRLVLIVLVSVIIVSSTRSVFTRATPSGEAEGDDKREEGVSKPAGAIEEIDRKGCIMQAAAHLGAFNMDEEMGARLEDARNFYFLEHYAGKYSNQNKPLERPVGCKTLIYNHDIIHSAVPCFSNSTVMGPVRDKQSMVQLAVDLIRATDESKLAMELYYACHDGRGAGDEMRLDGVFEAITGRSADRGLVRKPTRDECIEQAADFYNQVVINDKIKAHSKLAKDYYFKTLDRTSSKKAPKAPEDCERLNDRMSSFESVVPCYGDHTVMGPSKELNFTAVHRRTQAIRMAYEAWFACKGSLFAGQGLKAKGIFMATLGGIEM